VKSDLPYLAHIADSIAAIDSYVADGRELFKRERLIQDAVIRNFEIIGEAASKLSAPTRSSSEAVDLPVLKIEVNRLIAEHQ
jgi:uncharacterized protein with HEPN domain